VFDQLDISKQPKQITKATLADEAYGSENFHDEISK